MKRLINLIFRVSIVVITLLTVSVCSRIEGERSSEKIHSLELEIDALKDSLKKYNNGVNFNTLTLMAIGKDKVRLGDTVELDMFFKATNIDSELYPITPKIIIGEMIDSNLVEQITSIAAENWEGKVRFEANKLGKQILFGVFELPKSHDDVLVYPVVKEIEVVEK